MLLSKISINSWTIIHCGRQYFCRYCLHACFTEEILKCHIKNCFKINNKQTIKMPKKGEYVKFKNLERKIKSPFEQILKVSYCLKIMKGKIQMSVTLTNIKSMLLVVMAINQYALMINCISLLNHTQAKMLFTILLAVLSKKVRIVAKR